MKFRIGIDVGGTFTDFLLMDEKGDSEIFKVLSTPEDPSLGVFKGLEEMADKKKISLDAFLENVKMIVHGTTVTTNAVLTENWSKTGLLTTEGFRDAVQMRRGIREELYNNRYLPPKPVVRRYLRIPVKERIDYSGKIVEEVSKVDIEKAIDVFKKEKVEAIAISFLHSYANNTNEEVAAKIIEERMPEAYLTVSSRLLPQVRFYERTSTTVYNSSVGPILKRYLVRLIQRLSESAFEGVLLIMQSNGGVTSPENAITIPASTLLSGPAAGPIAGIAYISLLKYDDKCITVDMGGTSFDASMVKDMTPLLITDGTFDRRALALPMMDIHTIGAGGGSIAWIDDGGLLRMGPKSAGSSPGPVCYDRGGNEPTCTDADLILGYLNPDYFAGGRMRLNYEKAFQAIGDMIAKPLNLSVIEAAAGMFHVINVNMAAGIREVSVKKGYDPREFPLVCAGGAGPIHAAQIALELEIPRILIPKESSIFCAAGMLLADLKHDFVRTYNVILDENETDIEKFQGYFDEMSRQAEEKLLSEGVPKERHRYRYSLDMRYEGQYHEVNVEVTRKEIKAFRFEKICKRFHDAHNRHYGYDLRKDGTPIEVVNLRLTAIGMTEKPSFKPEPEQKTDSSRWMKGKRKVYLPSVADFREVPVYDGDGMGNGNKVEGPAIIEQIHTTIFVPPEYRLHCDLYGSFVLDLVNPSQGGNA